MRGWHYWLPLQLLFACSAANGAIYKWKDAQGNVHFSQTPPPKEAQVESSAKLDPRVGMTAIEASKNGNRVFCGRLHVMDIDISDDVLEEKINAHLNGWSRERELLDHKRQSDVSLNEKYAEYDCRVRWAYQQLETLRSFEYLSNKEYKNLEDELSKLKARREEECSSDPKKLGKSMLVGKEANDWGKCYNHYRYKIHDVNARMKENRKSLRQAQ